jgi:hypothetical protein
MFTVRYELRFTHFLDEIPFHSRSLLSSFQPQSMSGLWWTKWQYDRFWSQCLGFPFSVLFYPCCILIPTLILPLLIVHGGKAWKSSTKRMLFFERHAAIKREVVLRLFSLLQKLKLATITPDRNE